MKRILCAVLAVFALLALTGCGEKLIEEPRDIYGKRIAVLEGTPSVMYAQIYGSEVRVCSDKKELLSAIKLGDVDCALVDEDDESYVKRFQLGVKTLDDPFEVELRIAAAYENPNLIKDINSALFYLDDEGILKDIIKGHNKKKDEFVFEHSEVPEDAKTLTVGVCIQEGPFCYYGEDGELRGIEIDIAIEVCAYLGLKCEFEVMDWDDLIDAAWGGSVHFAMGCISETSPNAGKCIMSDPYAECTQIIFVD
ncbi:MAG: transporter substrate-binding domain-containing protein [Oscillospiraceae bacterium]|nr:transporter substrate-binding domain-containing protein [Oscillospiraceae bacterium]